MAALARPDQVYAAEVTTMTSTAGRSGGKAAPVIARRGTDRGSGPGTHRWVIEQSIPLLH
jgi:hypothetical protein